MDAAQQTPALAPEGSQPKGKPVIEVILEGLKSAYSSPAFWPALVMACGLGVIFWPLLAQLPGLWNGKDGYYSHGPLVPLISAFILYKWWPRIKDTPVKFGYLGIPFLVFFMVAMYPATISRIDGLLSVGMIAVAVSSVWVIAGFRWMLYSIAPLGYLAFCLPLWSAIVNNTTNPLQIISTKVAFELLKLSGFYVYQSDPTVIYMNNFQLNVEVPCSGLKLLLALIAFTVFFVLIARLKWWANLIALAMIPVLAILINGLRIALIGVVGETWGHDAGIKFHDYSGYITLVVCFAVLFKIFRWMGWKD